MTPLPERHVYVWDVPTRIFHWGLLALVLVAWFTGEEEGAAALVHRVAGEAIAGLIVFRVIWGFVGGEHARFSDFAAGPAAIISHVRNLFAPESKRHLGHNPLGGLAVFLLLATVAGIVVTGLFSGGEDNSGPFTGLWGLELSELHEVLFRVLQVLVVIHILGVIVETVKTKDRLLPAMFTGRKHRRADEEGADARRAGSMALIIALAAGATSAVLLLNNQPSRALVVEDSSGFEDEHREEDEGREQER